MTLTHVMTSKTAEHF